MSRDWSGRRASRARARLAHTLPRPCYRCGVVIPSASECKEIGIKWDVEHTVSLAEGGDDSTLSVSHSACNRSAGGKLGHALKKKTVVVRAIETERTTKFWNLRDSRNKIRFFLTMTKALAAAPSFFLSEASK